MATFNIVKTDNPFQYRDRIIRMWQAYLPGTPRGRLEWMQNGNPAGPAVWFLAFEEGSHEIGGTVAIMPRRMHYDNEPLLAGILGDFMVDEKYRVFGPNIKLTRAALESLGELGLSFIYTVPNEASRMVVKRAGVQYATMLDCYARPIDMRYYLGKYIPGPVAMLLSLPMDMFLRLSSREMRRAPAVEVEETDDIGEAFDRLWNRLKESRRGLIGDRSAEYMRWRYLCNPLSRFRFLTCRMRGERELSGYAVFSVREERKIDVYDLQALEGDCLDGLIRELISLGRAEGHQAVYYVAPNWSPLLGKLRHYRFFDTKDALRLGFFGEPDIPLEEWEFTSSDRNI